LIENIEKLKHLKQIRCDNAMFKGQKAWDDMTPEIKKLEKILGIE